MSVFKNLVTDSYPVDERIPQIAGKGGIKEWRD